MSAVMHQLISVATSFRPQNVYRGWWVVLVCSAIGAFGGGVYFYGFTLFFNPLRDELGLTSAQTSLVFSLTRLEGAFEGVIVGFLIDRYGGRKVMNAGVLIAGIGFLLWAAIVNSYAMFIFIYVGVIALGINGGFFHPALAVANNWFVKKRATAMAAISVGVGIGGAILVPIIGWVIASYGWRPAAAASGIGLLLLIWPLTFFIRHSPEEVGLLPDGIGLEQDNALTADPQEIHKGPVIIDEPTYTVTDAFKTSAMWILIGGITLRFCAHTAVMVHLAPLLEDRGMSSVAAAGAIGVLVLLSVPGRLFVGWLGDRYTKSKVVSALLVVQVVSLVILAVSRTDWQLYLFILLWAIAYGAGILNWAIVGDYFGRAKFATLRGMMGVIYSFGAVFGPIFAGWINDRTGEYSIAVWVFAILTGLAAGLYWICVPPKTARDLSI